MSGFTTMLLTTTLTATATSSAGTELEAMMEAMRSRAAEPPRAEKKADVEEKVDVEKAPPSGTVSPALTFDRRIEDAGASLGVYTRISSVIPRDSSFAIVSPIGALVRFELGVEYAPVSPVDGFAVELGLSAGAQSRRAYQASDGLFGLTSLQISGVYRLPVWSYFSTYGRGTAGVNWAHLTIREAVGNTEIDDVSIGFSGAAALGAEFAVPVGYTKIDSGEVADQWLGFHFEVGYALHTSHAFTELARDTNDDTDPPRIRRVGTDGGDVDLSGVIWRMGAAFRF